MEPLEQIAGKETRYQRFKSWAREAFKQYVTDPVKRFIEDIDDSRSAVMVRLIPVELTPLYISSLHGQIEADTEVFTQAAIAQYGQGNAMNRPALKGEKRVHERIIHTYGDALVRLYAMVEKKTVSDEKALDNLPPETKKQLAGLVLCAGLMQGRE